MKNNMVVNFPDPNLEATIRLEINKPTGKILASDLVGITELYASMKKISNITGLEYCTALTDLSLHSNSISDISPLRGLIKLTFLRLYNNEITDISPLSELTALTELDLEDNSITNISPLSGLYKLTELYLEDNSISDISPLSGLTGLTELYLNNNNMEMKPGTTQGQTNLDVVNWHIDNGCSVECKYGTKKETCIKTKKEKINDEMITITKKEYDRLMRDACILECLEDGRGNSWYGYGKSLKERVILKNTSKTPGS